MAEKIRILHVAEAPGGVEQYLVTLLVKLKKNDRFEHILICSDLYDESKFIGLVSYFERVSDMHNAISLKADLASVRGVRKQIKKYNPDIVYCHSSKAGAIGRLADIGIKNKLIYNAHGWSFNMKGAGAKRVKAYELIERMLSPITDRIVCISEYEKKSALEHGICKEGKLVVINNGIDFDQYFNHKYKKRSEIGIPENAFVIGTIGRLTRQKAPDVFVKMAVEVKKKIPDAFFVMVGDDIGDADERPFRTDTENLIKRGGLEDSFLITGWIKNPLDYAACFDVAVLLSRWEGFGLVLPEYMILNKPIVATKVDAIPYVIRDVGILIDSEDYKAAAESVIRIKEDEQLRSRLIENGKKQVEHFNVQRTAEEHINLFYELVQ